MQARLNVLVVVSAPVGSLPEVALGPTPHAPEEAQDAAFVEDQVSVDDPPLATDGGVAARDTVVAGGDTVTVAGALAAPPDPVQERLNVLVLVNAPVDWLPEVALGPTPHAPEDVQDVAFVEDQVSVDDPPLATVVGFAASDTVGTGGGGGVPDTVTVAVALVLPPELVQVRE